MLKDLKYYGCERKGMRKREERDFCKNLDKSGNCCIIDCNGKRTAREVI